MVAQAKDKRGRVQYRKFEKLFDREKIKKKAGGVRNEMSEQARRRLEYQKRKRKAGDES